MPFRLNQFSHVLQFLTNEKYNEYTNIAYQQLVNNFLSQRIEYFQHEVSLLPT